LAVSGAHLSLDAQGIVKCVAQMNPGRIRAYVCFDPRDPTQSIADRATWKLSDNAILISATMLFAAYGDRYPISWDKVAALADLCEADDAACRGKRDRQPLLTLEETNAMLRTALDRSPNEKTGSGPPFAASRRVRPRLRTRNRPFRRDG
jgi:hypothetical protein